MIIENLKQKISSIELCERYRQSVKDFTRRRTLGFKILLVLILTGHKMSLQNALNKFFRSIGAVFQTPSASAYCQARQKIKAEVFVELNALVRDDFYRLYEAEGKVKRWLGHRLLGADGTFLTLPDTSELRGEYSVHRNQKKGEREYTVQAVGVVLYDLLNDLAVRGALAPSHSAEKRLVLDDLWSELEAGDCLVLDRNSCDYTIIAQAVRDKIEVVIRCPATGFKAVREFFQSDERERVVKIGVSQSARTRKYVKAEGLAEEIEVRLLKYRLPSGESEVLLTTLTDTKKYAWREFYKVYGKRWGDETYYDRLKNIYEVERFSGLSAESIKQGFYGVIFLATLESVLSAETESEMQELAHERELKTMPQVNHAVSYVALVGEVGKLLLDERVSVEETLRELKYLFQKTPSRERKGRRTERKKLSHASKLRYQKYRKRVLA